MGLMHFILPPGLSQEVHDELEWASVTGGQDQMPWPAEVQIQGELLSMGRSSEESGCLLVPWEISGAGRIMARTATLIERPDPYGLLIELARGKVNQIRGLLAGWTLDGHQFPEDLCRHIEDATRTFCRAVARFPGPASDQEAGKSLSQAYRAAENLIHAYAEKELASRRSRQDFLKTRLGCRLYGPLNNESGAALSLAVNTIALPFSWKEIQPSRGSYQWEASDAIINWAQGQDWTLTGGPLIDFSGGSFPNWIREKASDWDHLCACMVEYVATVVGRYRDRIRFWQITESSNLGQSSWTDDFRMWTTLRLVEAARGVDANLETVIGLSQPWGDYLPHRQPAISPFVFADTLVRTGIKLAALELEILPGIRRRGSYCRDVMELSQLLELYSYLGLPLHVTLGYPSAPAEWPVRSGAWHGGFTPSIQADWGAAFAELCLAKPFVNAVTWIQFADGRPNPFPHCGLFDAQENPKPVLERLTNLKRKYLASIGTEKQE